MSAEKVNKPYRSCHYLESGITFLPHELGFCCDRPSPSTIQPMADASKTVDAFLEMRDRVIHENQGISPPCEGCSLFQNYKQTDGKIQYINFGVHNYCQFACTYCALQGANAQDKNSPENYDALQLANELKRRGLLSKTLDIACASGEISIHPKRDKYYDFIEENADSVVFASNAGKFDARIAHILSLNPRNSMLVSIDCGTAETFRQVRGVDMFERVIKNLSEYRKYSSSILLKYILLDENCNDEDLLGFVQICKELNIAQMVIAGDGNKAWDYEQQKRYEEHIVTAAIKLVEGAMKYKINFSFQDVLGQANLKEIYRRLASNPIAVSAEQELDQVLSASKVVCYGAGGNCENVLNQIKELGLRQPDTIWDKKAEGTETAQKFCAAGHEYPVFYPDFEQLNDSSDVGVFITITNGNVNQTLLLEMENRGFKNMLTYDRLKWALIAKRARTNA